MPVNRNSTLWRSSCTRVITSRNKWVTTLRYFSSTDQLNWTGNATLHLVVYVLCTNFVLIDWFADSHLCFLWLLFPLFSWPRLIGSLIPSCFLWLLFPLFFNADSPPWLDWFIDSRYFSLASFPTLFLTQIHQLGMPANQCPGCVWWTALLADRVGNTQEWRLPA